MCNYYIYVVKIRVKRKLIARSMIAVLLFILVGCGCKHEYDDGKITREPTCTEEGEKTFICEFCGDSYT